MTNKKAKNSGRKDKLSSAIPARLYEDDAEKLRQYEEKGLNISDLIRRCVKRSLSEVVREIREDLGQDGPTS